MRLRPVLGVIGAVVLAATATEGLAATCTREEFVATVDRAGASLRNLMAVSAPTLQARMRQLKDKRGWSEAEFEEKAYALLGDNRIADFDRQMSDLVQRVDTLGSLPPSGNPDCAKMSELEAASLELQATVRARSAFIVQRLDALIAEGAVPRDVASAAQAPVPSLAPPAAPPAGVTAKAPVVASAPPSPTSPPTAPKLVPPKTAAASGAWSTTTAANPGQQTAASAPPVPPPPPPPATPAAPSNNGQVLLPDDESYSINEIIGASEGIFGKVSANLGAVIEHAFSNSGRPTGYIIGSEGGGALVAGLRYGQGTLFMRRGGVTRVHWHGPSLGFDIGASGAKVMFLVYKLADPESIFTSFTGLEGSAYVVGGIGLTLISNGQIQMAPIRSGLGLRVGASLGYVKFTRKATWNPF